MIAKYFGRMASRVSPQVLARAWGIWAPFRGAGIRVDRISSDFRETDVSMKITMRNRNIVGTHFGGSLYAMSDPFYMVMLLNILGSEYIVWDKSAQIKFVKPGKTKVFAKFRLSLEEIEKIKIEIEKSEKGTYLLEKKVEVLDTNQQVVAVVDKVIYIKKKGS